jgi:hypothetical protein
LAFAEARPGQRIEGVYRRPVDLASGRFAVIERSRDFTLVPWKPALDGQEGRAVSGVLREAGDQLVGRARAVGAVDFLAANKQSESIVGRYISPKYIF